MSPRAHASHDALITSPATGLAGFTSRLLRRVARMVELHRQRRQLASLVDRLLDDIGLTREEVARELQRSIWK